VHAASQARAEQVGVSRKAVYAKLERLEPGVSAALVRHPAARWGPLIAHLGGALPALRPGYRVQILDGNHLAGTQHRLKELRATRAGAWPGQALVVLDPARMLVVAVFPDEDGHAPERAALRRALAPFAEVSPVALGPDSFALAGADRLAEPYRPLLELCRLLAESPAPGEAGGPSPCPAFLLDLERVFERYVTAHCVDAWDGRADRRGRWAVRVQRLRKLITADLYQVLAYCAALGVGEGALVYPGRRNEAWEYRFEGSPIRVTVRTLRVVGSRAACRAAARRLARDLGR
jgi:hypothetical protein